MGHRRTRMIGIAALLVAVLAGLLSGPVAVWLQARTQWAAPGDDWCAVYLVAGARAQDRRIAALEAWLATRAQALPLPPVLVGNDAGESFWSRSHQRNLTRAEWAVEKLTRPDAPVALDVRVVPGQFFSTDAEMQALAVYLEQHPETTRLALVTSRFHGRRVLQRFAAHAPAGSHAALVPGVPFRENRLPWVVAVELLKLLRDRLGLSGLPLLTRERE